MLPPIQWRPAAGFAHVAAIPVIAASLPAKTDRIIASRSAALNLALACGFAAESLLWFAGVKPMPVKAAPALELPAGTTLSLPGFDPGDFIMGDSAGAFTASDLDWSKDKVQADGSVRTTARRAAARCYLATQRAVRELVQSARPLRPGLPLQLDDNFAGPVPTGIEGLGALPIALLVAVVVVAAFAMAAYAWNDVETSGQVVALKKQEAISAAEVKTAVDLCTLQIAAGGECDVPAIIAKMSKAEKSEGTILPLVGVAGVIALVGGIFAWRRFRSRPLVAA